jgi:hypothetical protein
MQMFAILENAKPDTENVGAFSLAAVKRVTFQVIRLPF